MDSTFYLGIKKILLAHEYVLDHAHRCEYHGERGSYGLVYVIRGEAKYIFSTGERVTLRPGDVFFISPKSAYAILCDGEFLHDTINFLLY
ncbi:MAG: AraC family ligand binding domain-containing protein, partial [Clostridia bacterium]|nr:AraC family ligand binding domain-containing protein [Clostridia bacterium]